MQPPSAVLHHRFPPHHRRVPPFSLFHLRQCVLVSFQYASSAPICFNTIQDALHQALLLFHHFSPSTSSSLRLLHYKDGGACWNLHTPMQPQLRAYPYAYTLLPLYYISTSLSHWLSWPLGSKRLWASVARTFKVGDWESSWLFWTLPDHPQARIQLFRRLDGADRI